MLSLKTNDPQTIFSEKGTNINPTIPGDFILVSKTDWFSRLIQIGQHIRFMGGFSKWNHAALVVDDGQIIEATKRGIHYSDIRKYQNYDYYYVRINSSNEDRVHEVSFAKSCIQEKYGILEFISIIFSILLGSKIGFYYQGQQICSGLVAKSLERTGVIFPLDPNNICPALLAKWYNIS